MDSQIDNNFKQHNYQDAPRAVLSTDFPTIGFYLIHSISERCDLHGNRFPVALVDWRYHETGPWVDKHETKYLRLDYLYNGLSTGSAIEAWGLENAIIEVKYSCMSYSPDTPQGKALIDWRVDKILSQAANTLSPTRSNAVDQKRRQLVNSILSIEGPLVFDHDDIAYNDDFADDEGFPIEE